MKNVKVGNIEIGKGCQLVFIAGPCVIESREICFEIAASVKVICDALQMPYIFKASFDKANRTSIHSYRGPGLEKGLEILSDIKKEFNVPVCTDFHEPWQAKEIAEVVDLLQVPAFLCRQTDMIVSAAKTKKTVSIKKAQFLAPWDMKNVVEKFYESGGVELMLAERGSTFGYNNLIVDMRSLAVMRGMGVPLVFDATHSAQLPGGIGNATAGQKEFVPVMVKGAAAIGMDALFMEVHPEPEKGKSDATTMWKVSELKSVLETALMIDKICRF